MPRYCAVKFCRNRGGTASKQDNKRISFYPFPLQDKPRLQKWVDNMKREEWTPSRHQYLCSEHFTEDCFDIRWGIRYLKNTAIPTVFPSIEDEEEKRCSTIKRSPTAQHRNLDAKLTGFESPLSKRPLILSRTCKKAHAGTTKDTPTKHAESIKAPLLVSATGIAHDSNIFEVQAATCEISADGGVSTVSCLALSPCNEAFSEAQADSTVTVLCCETLGPLPDGENVDAATLQAALGQTFSFVPVEMVKDEPCFSEERGPSEGEHISVYEHAYCRPDTDKDQLWSKILSLHAKIVELDHREESTVGKIRALETEISLLKKDGAVFKEKQKVLEDYISSVLL
ncbi:THAP domain-containing protein 5-like [Notolabrus celidotus]|uniref:THAP domain-containing protein 5-like n=1 Tax=Notolabrus celidotus TaxID=1203425 RepID=UPI0014907316|nr:THAP domain-containing protein 5-like [Notolabrus celidotus]